MATPRKRLRPEEVRYVRQSLRLTQGKFARLLGVSRLTITRWEGGGLNMTPAHANLIRLVARVRGVRTQPPACEQVTA
jgi:DNA-binding transcriptional regulator YiaG